MKIGRVVSVLVWTLLLAPSLLSGQEACGPPGPLRIRDMTPPAILRVGFMPSSASLIGKGRWGFESHYSLANIFLMSDSVERYLKDREVPTPLSPEDFQGILDRASGDVFYFDGEIGLLTLGVHFGLTDRIQIFGEMPYFTFGGGSLDHAIMEFHDTFGIGQAGRDLVARDQYQVLMRFGDGVFSMADAPRDGFGDPTIGLRHSLPFFDGPWTAAMEWAVKPAVADEKAFLSNGHTDFGIQFMLERHWRRGGLYLSASYVWLGNFDLADFSPADIPSLTVAYSHRLSSRVTAVVQGLVSGSIFSDETRSELSTVEYQMSFGVRFRTGPMIVSAALTENLVNFQNTPDIGFHLGLCYVLNSVGRN